MIRFLRILGIVFVVIGALVILSWFIEPLRQAWPFLMQWFQSLPVTIQFGLIIAAIGFTILLSAIVWERLEDRKKEGNLLDD